MRCFVRTGRCTSHASAFTGSSVAVDPVPDSVTLSAIGSEGLRHTLSADTILLQIAARVEHRLCHFYYTSSCARAWLSLSSQVRVRLYLDEAVRHAGSALWRNVEPVKKKKLCEIYKQNPALRE
eukprot:1160582-Rhodomonas_salina.2